jgi:holo-[acyl-carrier protein] synthase
MIVGIGVDMIEIERIDQLVKRQPKALQRFLTREEQKLLGGKSETRQSEMIAGRYAAKEAGAKALGTGIGEVLSFLDMEILPTSSGRPELTFHPEVYGRLGLDPFRMRVHVSISHSQSHAIAQVVVEEQ